MVVVFAKNCNKEGRIRTRGEIEKKDIVKNNTKISE